MSRQADPRVRHRFLGRGNLIRWIRGGRQAVVAFDYGRVLTVRGMDLSQVLEDGPRGRSIRLPKGAVAPIPKEYGNGDRFVIEAFRLGIVPERGILDWTYGRDGELSYLFEWLRDPTEAVMYLFGDYGSGKTHLLGALGQRALDEGWAVARVPLDPLDSPPSSPKRVYRSLLRSLRWREDGVDHDAQDLLRRALDGGLRGAAADHRFLAPFVKAMDRGKDEETAWRWILGETVDAQQLRLPLLHDHTTASNIYSNLLTCLGWTAAAHAGRKGLLLLLDEAEMVTAVHWHRQLHRGINFIVGLSRAAQHHDDLRDEAIRRSPDGAVHKGERSGLIYSGHVPMRYLFEGVQGDRHTKVLFAVTPTRLMQRLVEEHDFDAMDIEPLPVDALEALFRTFTAHYQRVYGLQVPQKDLDRIRDALVSDLEEHGVQRRYVKGMVEGLDFRRFHPGRHLDDLLGVNPFAKTGAFGDVW
ncbi:MAG: BREX system ATP-binding domain-containing protein [Pseudomonadota bacterium]